MRARRRRRKAWIVAWMVVCLAPLPAAWVFQAWLAPRNLGAWLELWIGGMCN